MTSCVVILLVMCTFVVAPYDGVKIDVCINKINQNSIKRLTKQAQFPPLYS